MKSFLTLRLLLPLLTLAATGAAADPATPTPPLVARNPDPATMRFFLAGDSIINRRISVSQAPGFDQLVARIRQADASFTNFETLIHDFTIPGEALSGGTYMGSPPFVADELKWAGFTLLGVANNHAFDFGVEGMRSTRKALTESGITFAGTGENLARARAPAYLETPKGRIALIACASTFPPASAAGQQRKDLPGRPGVNPLHFTTTYFVDAPTFATISKLSGLTRRETRAERETHTVQFLETKFQLADKTAIHTEANPMDLAEIVAAVRDARQEADWVIVSIHNHEGLDGNREVPPEFAVVFAHAVIDAGADLLVAHGPHVIRGVEVYKQRPIFYGMGDFIFENETVRFQPTENYESVGLPPSALPGDFFTARSKGDTISFPAEKLFWESVVAEPVFNLDRTLKSIRIYPLELGFGLPRPRRGRPYPATGARAQEIVERFGKLSAPFGTTVSYAEGVGTLSWKEK